MRRRPVTAYYNEHDAYAAQWLRNLIAAGHIAPGDVDERSICDVSPDELVGYRQCHFFAGIGVWSHALRSAGWADDREVWTGSCPCQPFSAAGKQGGFADERHLWPEFFRLISERRPHVVFGEQVASPDGLAWLDAVSSDMEGAGYAFGAVDTCAAGFGAPHIRQRLYFVGDTAESRRGRLADGESAARGEASRYAARPGVGDMGHALDARLQGHAGDGDGATGRQESAGPAPAPGASVLMADSMLAGRPERRTVAGSGQTAGSGGAGELAHTEHDGLDRPQGAASIPRSDRQDDRLPVGSGIRLRTADGCSVLVNAASEQVGLPGCARKPRSTNGRWADVEWLPCQDGKSRPAQPGTFPLAHGATQRVGRLRAYGNALCAPQAEEFIAAAMFAGVTS